MTKAKKKTGDADSTLGQLKAQFIKRTSELWDKHEEEVLQILEESEEKKMTLSFAAQLDLSESSAQVKTVIKFSQNVTDSTEDTLDDPNQLFMPEIVGAAGPGKKRGKKKAKDDDDGGMTNTDEEEKA